MSIHGRKVGGSATLFQQIRRIDLSHPSSILVRESSDAGGRIDHRLLVDYNEAGGWSIKIQDDEDDATQ